MTSKRTIRQVAVALMLLVAFLLQGTWALAGVTGGLGGFVTDNQGHPVAGASVKVLSASQAASTTTDASGHFTFLALAPDTYTVSIVKDGYAPLSESGVSVFADNNLALTFQLQPQLKTIANVTSTAAGSLVKAGIGGDIYSVNSSQIQAAAALGGGANLNNAYSAIASVPGVSVPIGGMGWNQAVEIHGAQPFFTGYEYDGVPVNRAFDNYNASTESNLGLQELQVYTGGGPSSNSSSGTAGFINQVIKTGTYPGYLSVQGGVGSPTFYHSLTVEAGGASPDRNFSYYVGLSGYNQAFRFLNNSNDATGLGAVGGPYSGYGTATANEGWLTGQFNRGDLPLCTATADTPASVTSLPSYQLANATWETEFAGTEWPTLNECLDPYPGNYDDVSLLSDRENVVNFHFGIPRKNGLRDDVQLLWSASSLKTYVYSAYSNVGSPIAYGSNVTGADNANVAAYGLGPTYIDGTGFYLGVPFGTPIAGVTPSTYLFPDSPTDRALDSELPDVNDNDWNDTGITKISFTHSLSENSFVRVFGYTFFSDWNMSDPYAGYSDYEWGVGGACECQFASNYILPTHTTGGELQFVDQVNDKNLFTVTANYTTANLTRWNNVTNYYPGSAIGYISESNGVYSCWDPTTGDAETCAPGNSYGSYGAIGPTGTAPPGSAAALAGAQWETTWQDGIDGSDNTVIPKFSVLSAIDEFRPNDRWLIDASLRYEGYTYGLPDSATAATNFYSQIVSTSICQNTSTGLVLSYPLPPGAPPPAPIDYTTTCPAGYDHPPFTSASPNSYSLADISPRLSATYTQSPDTVWRGSVGRYVEPPLSASVQYLNAGGNELSVWSAALPYGFDSPFHPIPLMSAMQADGSLERHIRGTDISFKLSPFFNYTTRYQEQSYIGPGFVTQAPVGDFRSYGVELGVTKGDFSKNGFSGAATLTYTNAAVRYIGYLGTNQLSQVAGVIQQYDALTKAGGGAPCYTPYNGSPGVADPTCAATSIVNPYYNQPYVNPYSVTPTSGWYPIASTGLNATDNPTQYFEDVPLESTIILNYRKDRLAITPSLQLAEGSSYGGPFDVNGIDPRMCAANQATDGVADPQGVPAAYGVAGAAATNCDYWSLQGLNGTASAASAQLFIPNPQTGQFATLGQYREPWILVGNIQLSYDFSPRLTGIITVADLFHDCFGGSKEPWTSAYAPGSNVCGYYPSSLYVSNFYNGSSPYDTAANGITPYPWQTNSYAPSANYSEAGGIPAPLNVYFQLRVRM